MKNTITAEKPMAKTATIKLRVEATMRDRIKEIAAHEDRSMSYIIEQAIADRIAFDEAQIRGIEQAIVELDRDGGIPHHKIRAWVESWGTDSELSEPEPEKII